MAVGRGVSVGGSVAVGGGDGVAVGGCVGTGVAVGVVGVALTATSATERVSVGRTTSDVSGSDTSGMLQATVSPVESEPMRNVRRESKCIKYPCYFPDSIPAQHPKNRQTHKS